MGVVTRSENNSGDGKQKYQPKVVDIMNDKSLAAGTKSKLDPNEDAWEFSAPPVAGDYWIQLHLAKDAVTQHHIDPDDTTSPIYYTIAIEAKTVDCKVKEDNGAVVFPRVSTRIGMRKHISTAAGLLKKMKYKVPEEADDLTIAKLVYQAIKNNEPKMFVHLEWNGYSKNDKKTVFATYEDFPDNPDGSGKDHKPWITNSNGGREQITAQLQVTAWHGKSEADAKTSSKSKTPPASPVPEMMVDEEDEPQGKPVTPATTATGGKGKGKEKAKGAGASSPPPVEVEDEEVTTDTASGPSDDELASLEEE